MSMNTTTLRRILPTALLVVGLAGCNGGGGDSQVAGGGIGGTGGTATSVSFGEVTQQGSIFVNGVEFDTTNAQIIKDDALLQPSDMQLGMTVEVHGRIDSATKGVAYSVLIDEAVRGEVESVDNLMSENKFTILGQDVLIDQSTRFATGTTIT